MDDEDSRMTAGRRLRLLIFKAARRILKGAMTDDQFSKLSDQISKLDDGFLKLYRHMEERFDSIDSRFDETHRKFSQLQPTVDGIAGDLDTVKTELTVHSHNTNQRLNQHEAWITQLADHGRVDLEPQT